MYYCGVNRPLRTAVADNRLHSVAYDIQYSSHVWQSSRLVYNMMLVGTSITLTLE